MLCDLRLAAGVVQPVPGLTVSSASSLPVGTRNSGSNAGAAESCPTATPKCQDYMLEFYEYGAMGASSSGSPTPTVPIRSQSGDWRMQVLDPSRPHDRMRFPVMSVTRSDGSQIDYHGQQTFDPKGHRLLRRRSRSDRAQFIATVRLGRSTSGRFRRASPSSIADADEVEIMYVVPTSLVSQVSGADALHQRRRLDRYDPRTPVGTWTGKIPRQPHNTLVRWYVESDVRRPGRV